MNFKSAEKWLNNLMSNELLLVLLMILIVIVIIDCNTKMFSKMLEGNSPDSIPIKNNIPMRCGNDYRPNPKIDNPTNAAKQNCPYKPTEMKPNIAPVTGYDSDLVLYASYDKPLGPTIPRTMQQDYTTLQAFGLTKMPDVVNYLTGPGPQNFAKVSQPSTTVPSVPSVPVKSPSSGKKEVHVKMYYAPWCGHSNKAKPEFDKVINKHNNNNINGVNVKASIVNSEENKDEVKKQNVQGFPTYKVHVLQDGKEIGSSVLNLADRSLESIEKAVTDFINKL